MANFLSWMRSFFTTIAFWIIARFSWIIEKGKGFTQVQSEHREKLRESIQSLEKCWMDMGASCAMNVLHKHQCVHLYGKLILAMKGIDNMLSIGVDDLEIPWVFEELFGLQEKVELVGRNCTRQEQWSHSIVFQLHNRETFRELLLDLKCCYDSAYDVFLSRYPHLCEDIVRIAFDAATLQQVQEDGEVLKKKLEVELQDEGLSQDRDIVQHLLLRLRNLDRVDGGDLATLEVPKEFETPKLTYLIGEGAGGKVHKSNWLGLACATKVFKDNLANLLSCRNEVGILAGLSHPNLVQFLGCGINEKVEGKPEMYLVMEMMECSLATMLTEAKRPLPYHLAIDVMHQIAKGVYYLHDMQVAHLDLKPDNVLSSSKKWMASNPTFKVTDYGTSQLEVCSNPASPNHCEIPVGTRSYMAPEVMMGSKNPMYPFQADVWSFAMTCSEILSRKRPYFDLTSQELRVWSTNNPSLRPALPNNCKVLTNLIEECWAEDPLQRPTFASICERLTSLKKSFLKGMYSLKMVPHFDSLWASQESMLPLVPKVMKQIFPPREVVEDKGHVVSKALGLLKMDYIGIVGMGGIGKTTLAKAMFDDGSVRSLYDAAYFVDQCKNYPSSYAMLCEILPKLRRDDYKPKNVGDALKMMEELLVAKKVLLVLDDVDNEGLVNEIVPPNLVQASKGTTIIITTRNWSAIKSLVGEKGRLNVELLDEEASISLFNSHLGWDASMPSPDFEDLRHHVVKACNGLPLSLKVMGAFLRGKKRLRSWERALQRMAKGKDLDGDERIWKTLQVSFDGLNNNVEKQIFLDVACFFCKDVYPCGISKETILLMWSRDGILPMYELERLIDMSLLKVNKVGDILEMHDQLRDMGRSLSKKTRIWKASMIPESGFSSKDIERLEGISWPKYEGRDSPLIKVDTRHQFKNLRVLILRRTWDDPIADIQNLTSFLCFASQCVGLEAILVENSKTESVSSKLNASVATFFNETFSKVCKTCSSLKIMDLSQQPFLEELPNNFASSHTLLRLDLNQCPILKALQLKNFCSLTSLDLGWCENLAALPIELGKLSSLISLDLSGCRILAALPGEMGNLLSLKTLDLSGCKNLAALPVEVGELSSLAYLNLSGCENLAALPSEVGNLLSLKTFDLSGCENMAALPVEVGELSSLAYLNLSGCKNLAALPSEVGNLSSLKTFDLSGCENLVALPIEVGKLSLLTSLDLSGCDNLTSLPSEVGSLLSLETFNLSGCDNLAALPIEVGKLSSLAYLNLDMCQNLASLPSEVGNLSSLTTLCLGWCWSLAALPIGLGKLSSLTSLDLTRCENLAAFLVELGNFSSLTSLTLSRCENLVVLPVEVGNLSSLIYLNLSVCSNLATLPIEVGNLSSLTSLYLSGCTNLVALPVEVGNLSSLTFLDLSGCEKLVELPSELDNLLSLTSLDLSRCINLVALPTEVGKLLSLTYLNLSGCKKLATLPVEVGNLSSLTSLELSGCENVVALLVEVGNFSSLTSSNLSGCGNLAAMAVEAGNLSSLTTLYLSRSSNFVALPLKVASFFSLTSLNLSGCENLVTLPVEVGNLSSLTSLSLSGCRNLAVLPVELGNLSSLAYLNLNGCENLAALPIEVGNLSSLIGLDLRWCTNLVALPVQVGNLSLLTTLCLTRCSNLVSLPVEVGNLLSLTTLDLSECINLATLPVEVGNLSCLTSLNLKRCENLGALPIEVGNLSSLTSLDLSGCTNLMALPIQIGNLRSLETFDLSGCENLIALPSDVGNLLSLETLDLGGCANLVALPVEVGNLSSLAYLNLSGCENLGTLPIEVGNLSSLTTLDLNGCTNLAALPLEVGNLSSLTSLDRVEWV